KEHGEGNYEATRDYDERTKRFIESGQVEEAAENAAPHDAGEADEMREAEEIGKAAPRRRILRYAKASPNPVNAPANPICEHALFGRYPGEAALFCADCGPQRSRPSLQLSDCGRHLPSITLCL
ncbi:MAG: hypothetical protein ABJC33_03550, partial [Betaproteobacteria bacterium]